MSSGNAEKVRASIEAYNRGDFDAALAFFHPEIEWRWPPIAPDVTTLRGHSAIRRFWTMGTTVFGDFHLEIAEVSEHGDLVLGHFRFVGRGLRSGVLTNLDVHAVGEFEDGLVIRLQYFLERAQALKAAGLSDTERT